MGLEVEASVQHGRRAGLVKRNWIYANLSTKRFALMTEEEMEEQEGEGR